MRHFDLSALLPSLQPAAKALFLNLWQRVKRHRAFIASVLPYIAFYVTHSFVPGKERDPEFTIFIYYAAAAMSGFIYEFLKRGMIPATMIAVGAFFVTRQLFHAAIPGKMSGDAGMGVVFVDVIFSAGIFASILGTLTARMYRVTNGEKLITSAFDSSSN